MKVTVLFSNVLSEVVEYIKSSRHLYLTPEHMLAKAIESEVVANILKRCNADLPSMKVALSEFLEHKVPKRAFAINTDGFVPSETLGFQSVMNRAAFIAAANERNAVDIVDVLVSMMDETKNYCSFILRKNNVKKEDLVELIERIRKVEEGDFASKERNEGSLSQYCVNMTARAAKGEYDVLIGREEELERTINILGRRMKNNPLHVGDSGVGKTAITQGLAARIVQGRVPEFLRGAVIYSLDLTLMLSGSKFRGEFEERLHKLIDELMRHKKAILFIDEIHMILGAGNNGTSGIDAANILKPALSSGKLRCIGSTTYEEFTREFEKDKALLRRFQKVDINEPTEKQSEKILQGLSPRYASYHGVRYTNGALSCAIRLSRRYMMERRLPDKAIDIMDEAGANAKILCSGGYNGKLFPKLTEPVIGEREIKKMFSKLTGIEFNKLEGQEKTDLRDLEETLLKSIYGQDGAVHAVVNAVKRNRAGLAAGNKPISSFLFVGPTGVGKTELTKVLAASLKLRLLRYDMSEYQERHTVSRLVGSPPGYVGHDSGGQLVNDVRQNSSAVILFDEIEKAHPDVYNIFLQIMDYGVLTDSQGRKADFRNCLIVMTSNAGAELSQKAQVGFGEADEQDEKLTTKEEVKRFFAPEFRNRLTKIIHFSHLGKEEGLRVVKKECAALAERLALKKIAFSVSESAENLLYQKGYSKEYGARNIARTVEDELADPLVDMILFGKLEKGGRVSVDADGEKLSFEISVHGENKGIKYEVAEEEKTQSLFLKEIC